MKIVGVLLLAAALAACGGGGGSAGSTSGTTTSSSTSGSTTGGGTGSATVNSPTMSLALVNASGGAVTSIALGGGFEVRATVKDASGQVVAGKLVTFAVSGSSIGVVTPTTALTDSSGVAKVAIAPASMSSIGAATVKASADVEGTAVSAGLDFAVQASSLTLSAVTAGNTSLTSGGNTPVKVTAMIGGAPVTAIPVNITFAASCGKINNQSAASGVGVTTDGTGVASAIYDAVSMDGTLCSGAVTITAASAGAAPSSTTVNVAAPTANAVVFVSSTPPQIFVAGSGAVDQSIAKFKVLTSAGSPMSGVSVNFSIVTNPGGVGLNSAGSTTPVTVTTGATGEASVAVFSGTIPGPVKVRAELASNSLVFAESQNLTVASGPASQDRMSLSVETFNIEGAAVDGASTLLTVRVADRQGNPVEDGTVINFTAEGGQIASSCATTRANNISSCSVTFISQNPRPANGRVSILAYTEGTKKYVDINGNNAYDVGVDTLYNLGDAYRDDNENGVFDAANGEFRIPRGGTLACAGSGAPYPGVSNSCDSLLKTTVRQQTVVLFSSSTPMLELTGVTAKEIQFRLRSVDYPLLPMPSGTTISVTTSRPDCVVTQLYGSPIVNVSPTTNPAADLATSHRVTLGGCITGDTVTVSVKAPSGLVTDIGPIVLP